MTVKAERSTTGMPAGAELGDGLHTIAGDEDVSARADRAGTDVNQLAGEDCLGDSRRRWRLGGSAEEERDEA